MVALTGRSTSLCATRSEVMPVQDYVLDSAGRQRVQIFQESSGEGETYILVNHSIVGSISHREELRAGKELTLKGGSVLFIQQTNDGYQVMYDGQPLRLVSPAEREATQKRALTHQRAERLAVVLPRIVGIGLALGIVGFFIFTSQSARSLPSASQPASYSVDLSRDQITPDSLNIVAARGERITLIFQVSDGIPGYWASATGLVLTLDGVSSPLTVLAPQANTWDQDGHVTCCDQQATTMTSTLTIPSTISGPKQRSLSGAIVGTIVYPVRGPATGLSPFGTYTDQTLNVVIPVQLQLVS